MEICVSSGNLLSRFPTTKKVLHASVSSHAPYVSAKPLLDTSTYIASAKPLENASLSKAISGATVFSDRCWRVRSILEREESFLVFSMHGCVFLYLCASWTIVVRDKKQAIFL